MLIKRNDWNLFDDFFRIRSKNEMLKTDIKEEENAYTFFIEIPGIEKENINLEVKDEYLNISVSKNSERKEESEKYLHQEICYGEYSRSFYIGNIEQKDIVAKCANGILTITVPKAEKIENKKLIEIDWQ